MIIRLILLLLIITPTGWSQDVIKTNPRKEKPLGFSFYAGGSSITGFSIDYFVIPNIDLEITLGNNLSGGFKYHFIGHKPVLWSPYIGFSANAKGRLGSTFDTRRGFYIPIGIHYIGDKAFSLSFEGGTWYLIDDDNDSNRFDDNETGFYPWGGIKIGIHIGN